MTNNHELISTDECHGSNTCYGGRLWDNVLTDVTHMPLICDHIELLHCTTTMHTLFGKYLVLYLPKLPAGQGFICVYLMQFTVLYQKRTAKKCGQLQ